MLIPFTVWGPAVKRFNLSDGKIRRSDESPETKAERACRQIERKTGLTACTVRPDGIALDSKGRPESTHYEITLGRPLRSGGYSVEGRLWVAIPVQAD